MSGQVRLQYTLLVYLPRMQIVQHIQQRKFEINGYDFSGKPRGKPLLRFSLSNSKKDKTTKFELHLIIEWIWLSDSKLHFDAIALNQYPSNYVLSLQELQDLGLDSYSKLLNNLNRHSEFIELNLPEEMSLSYGKENKKTIEKVWNQFNQKP